MREGGDGVDLYLTQWRFDREEEWVESYFLKGVSKEKPLQAIWLRFTFFLSKERRSAQLWFIFFEEGKTPLYLKENFDIEIVVPAFKEFRLIYPIAFLKKGETKGEIKKDGKKVKWELNFTTNSTLEKLLPSDLFYKLPFPVTKLVTLFPDELLSGSIIIDHRKVEVDSWKVALGHNWGKRHTWRYCWFHCNSFSEGGVEFIEGAVAKNKIKFIETPLLSIFKLKYKGKVYNFNGVKDWLSTKDFLLKDRVYLKGRFGEIKLFFNKENFITLDYENPDHSILKCYNSMFSKIEGKLFLDKEEINLFSDRACIEFGITE